MNLDKLREKLEKYKTHKTNPVGGKEVDAVLNYIELNVKAFTYANESLKDLEIYIVFKNTGGYKAFKTIKGNIIMDKLDTSYSESRELICISGWNIKKGLKVSFQDHVEVTVTNITRKELHTQLFTVIEPLSLKYVVGVEKGNRPTTIAVNTEDFKGLSYPEVKKCLESAYLHAIREESNKDIQTQYFVVKYTSEM